MLRALILIITIFIAIQTIEARNVFAQKSNEAAKTIRVHGRLAVYNGNPAFRIWIVGTKRVLGIHDIIDNRGGEGCPLPESLCQALLEDIDNRLVYADFTLRPVSKYEKGVMQFVEVISAENVIVATGDSRFLKRIEGIAR